MAVIDKNTLRLLSPKGEKIVSELPYELRQLPKFAPAEITVPVSGEFMYFADAASVKVCRTGTHYPVLMEGDYLKLERQYLATKTPGDEAPTILAQLEASIVNRQAMEGEGPPQSIRIDRLVAVAPGLRCERAMSTATLPNTYWRLLRKNAGAPLHSHRAREVHLVMHDSDASVSGFAGCNRFSGRYTEDGATLSFTPLASTRMACPDAQMQIEQDFHSNLGQVTAWRVQGQTLELYDAQGSTLMVFEAMYLP